jgi:type III restriction enzyme
MRFRFDPNQEHQTAAIEAVADLFEGQISYDSDFQLRSGNDLTALGNRLDLDDETLLTNLQAVQSRSSITPDDQLETIAQEIDTVTGKKEVRFANFSVEMETGTGKTYVYLRTALELNARYGMRKFIVVVPSVAIREGVLKTIRVTEGHLRSHYNNVVYRFYEYDSENLTLVKQFAQSDGVEIMVMTIDSFNKSQNVLRQSGIDRFFGQTPIHLIQATRPILILDEPQNMESEKSIAALALLHPLFALRYSATHRNPYNVVNRLTPAEAYRKGLVKRIEVDSVVQTNDANRPFLLVEKIDAQKNTVTATIKVHKLLKSGAVKATSVKVRPGDSLVKKTGRDDYADYTVDEINPGGGFIRFMPSELELRLGEEVGTDKDAVFETQIRHTIEEHLRKSTRLKDRGIKVLSLFFIDRVENYTGDAEFEGDRKGSIRKLFDQAFDEIKQRYPDWRNVGAADVRTAYFASKKRKGGQLEWLDSTDGRDKKEDQLAYDGIMRDKESLLSFPSPDDDDDTRKKKQWAFIFSHSALREGWDNPNVFQICTLNQTVSQSKKRQEVGRGVRLAVDQTGDRIQDEQVNILTVIANESYADYVKKYQDEIAFEYRAEIEARYGRTISDLSDEERRKVEEEYGQGILPPVPRKAGRRKAKLNKQRVLSKEFKNLWDRIKHKTRYEVKIDTEKLIADVLPELERADIKPPRITITKAQVSVDDDDCFIAMQLSGTRTAVDLAGRYALPNIVDIMSNLMEHTTPPVKVTRATLLQLFGRVKNRKPVLDNPHDWAAAAVRLLKEKLSDHLVLGIKYEKTGEWFAMEQILDAEEVEMFARYMVEPESSKKQTIYDLVPCDSLIEQRFVQDMEARSDVRMYVKLPKWFKVPTPVGFYEPDWAVVLDAPEGKNKPVLYFIAETKESPNLGVLRNNSRRKIECAAAHFGSKQYQKIGALDGVDYKVVTSAGELP